MDDIYIHIYYGGIRIYIYIYGVFRSLNERTLIADFYRRDNRINGRTPTLSRLIKRVASRREENGGENKK